MFVNI